jgi:transcriptional regulator with XRE-family HTH domain
MQINNNIRKYRKDKGFSQEYVGLKLNIDQPTYCRLEKGCINEQLLEKIAKAMDTNSDVLRDYHLPPKSLLPPEHFWEQLINQKDEIIDILRKEINYLLEINAELRDILKNKLINL